MGTRFIAVVLFCQMFLHIAHAAPATERIQFRLAYSTIYGGLKTSAAPDQTMPRLGLALAGGGAKAAASIGVLKVLQEEGIPVSCIAGTSMGAVVGGIFAAGYSAEEIERIFVTNDWNDIFTDTPARSFLTQEQKEAGFRHLLEFTMSDGQFMAPSGLSAGQKLMNLLAAKTLAASFEADLDFDRLAVPYRAVAADIENGDAVILKQGLLHEAIRASMAIPLVFQPVEINGRMLVDGGLVNNLPVDTARAMGSDVVIAVDSSAKLEKKERLASLIEIMSQSISLQVRRESERQARLADLVIMPDTSDYSFTDFPSMQQIIHKGEQAARAALPEIRALMSPLSRAEDMKRYRLTSLTVAGNVNVPEAAIRRAMAPELWPREATAAEIHKSLTDVFKLGYFADASLDLVPVGKGYQAMLTVRENPVVRAIVTTGNSVTSSEEIASSLESQINHPLNVESLAAQLDKIVHFCRDRGYLMTRVERVGMRQDGTLEIAFYEGRVDSITITGHTRTSRHLIRRETITRAGRPLNLETAAYDIQHLYALGYFESLSIDMAKSAQGGIDLEIRIKERPVNKIRLGLRYDLEDSFTGLTDIVVDNVTGRGIKFFLNTRYGNYTDIAIGYRSPVILRAYLVHTVDGFYGRRNYFIYEDKHKIKELEITRTGAEVAFGYQWFRFGDTYLRYRYAADTILETLGVNPPETNVRIGSLAFLSTVDTRDISTFAHHGTLFKGSYETASPSYGGNLEYRKTYLYGQAFLPLAGRHTLVLEATGGIGSGNIPYEEQYGIGGADYTISTPLPGYQRREFTGDNLLALAAAYRWKISEYQLTFAKGFYLNLAYHTANVWDKRNDISIKDLRSGASIGLYADTVIGPIRFDFGRGEQNRYSVYFSAGFDF